MNETQGWVVSRVDNGSFSLFHSSGWFLGGFETRLSALLWLQDYLLRIHAQQRKERLAQQRLLARMQPHGLVS